MKKIYKGNIPFRDYPEVIIQGKVYKEAYRSQMDYVPYREDVIWKENVSFVADIEIMTYSRGRSAANWDVIINNIYMPDNPEYEKFLEGIHVNVFMIDMLEIIRTSSIYCGKSHSLRFSFCKRGQNYGLCLVNDM